MGTAKSTLVDAKYNIADYNIPELEIGYMKLYTPEGFSYYNQTTGRNVNVDQVTENFQINSPGVLTFGNNSNSLYIRSLV